VTNLDRSTAGAAARLGGAWHVGENLTPISEVGELSDEQRAGVLAYFAERPAGGFKAALRSVGIRATTREARSMLLEDEQVKEVRLSHFGLDEKTMFTSLGGMVGDPGHKDHFNATKLGLNVLHGYSERAGLEVTGAGGAPVGVSVEHDFTGILDGLERIGVLRRGAPASDAADLPVLSARTDEAAVDSAGGASLPAAGDAEV
jgi:hypothetical protein